MARSRLVSRGLNSLLLAASLGLSATGAMAQDVIKFASTELTGYKVPKHVEFRTELPKTNVGKILRRELRDKK